MAPGFVFYKIALTRGTEVLVQLMGAVFAGILCSDRCPSYVKYHKGAGQFCWAHFKRNILGVQQVAKTTDAERFCRDALALHARLFRLWHRFSAGPEVRYGPVTREQLIAKSIPLEKKFFALADRYAESSDKDVRNLALALLNILKGSLPFSATRVWSPPTIPLSERFGALCSGARRASEAGVRKGKWQWRAC